MIFLKSSRIFLIYSFILLFCLGFGIPIASLNSFIFFLNQLTCEIPSMLRLNLSSVFCLREQSLRHCVPPSLYGCSTQRRFNTFLPHYFIEREGLHLPFSLAVFRSIRGVALAIGERPQKRQFLRREGLDWIQVQTSLIYYRPEIKTCVLLYLKVLSISPR